MKSKRAYLVTVAVIAAVMLATACMPRGADVTDVGRSTATPARSGRSDAAGVVARAPHATRTPLTLLVRPDPVLPTPSPEPTQEQNEPEATPTESGVVGVVGSTTQPASAAAPPVDDEPAADQAVALPRVEDVDPAPPFSIRVDAVRLVDGGAAYKVAGYIRNDGGETYEGIGVEATFYADSEWDFGPFDAICGCYTLAPGSSCAFVVEAYARPYTGYRLHAIGHPQKSWTGSSTQLTVAGVSVRESIGGYVRITGAVRNQTASTVNTVRVTGALRDRSAVVVSVGNAIVVGELPPGAEVTFDLRIPYTDYTDYIVEAEGRLQ